MTEQVASMGAAKAELGVAKTTILSLLAGVYISLGGLAMLSVGGATPGLASVRAFLTCIIFCQYSNLIQSHLSEVIPPTC